MSKLRQAVKAAYDEHLLGTDYDEALAVSGERYAYLAAMGARDLPRAKRRVFLKLCIGGIEKAVKYILEDKEFQRGSD